MNFEGLYECRSGTARSQSIIIFCARGFWYWSIKVQLDVGDISWYPAVIIIRSADVFWWRDGRRIQAVGKCQPERHYVCACSNGLRPFGMSILPISHLYSNIVSPNQAYHKNERRDPTQNPGVLLAVVLGAYTDSLRWLNVIKAR